MAHCRMVLSHIKFRSSPLNFVHSFCRNEISQLSETSVQCMESRFLISVRDDDDLKICFVKELQWQELFRVSCAFYLIFEKFFLIFVSHVIFKFLRKLE